MTNTEAINELKSIQKQYKGGTEECSNISEAIDIAIKVLENDWIPCTVKAHPKDDYDCEVTINDCGEIKREVAFYAERWRRSSDEYPLDVIAWKKPSKPFIQ